MTSRPRSRALSWTLIVLVGFLTTRIPIGPAYSAVGPRIFPWLIAGALVVIGLLMVFGIRSYMRGAPAPVPAGTA